jgi:hypothetical protein
MLISDVICIRATRQELTKVSGVGPGTSQGLAFSPASFLSDEWVKNREKRIFGPAALLRSCFACQSDDHGNEH